MALFKCKMCGGSLEIVAGTTVVECQYCGTKQTLPRLSDERISNLYDRANHFRRNNEFDKAMGIYEQILNNDNTDAESYWSLVLCRYGIEYVEDPTSHKRIPTVNRAQFTSVFDDEDYKSALQYADGYQKELYEQEATAINNIQKGILAISGQEEPFDVFICYKESDANGRRTPDSVLATELYHELTREGYKVFFSRITLEDKLGQEYEPYIFAALNSAKVMVVLGTKPEYFNAVWVKNEWSRYLALIKNGARKMLIPAYRDMDPYNLPDEFSHLQAQDMSKLGFMQDLTRGVQKIIKQDTEKSTTLKTVITNEAPGNIEALLKRGFLALEDGEWAKAEDFFEQCLNQNAELAEAYLGKLMAELCVKTQEELADCEQPFDDRSNYQKAVRFGDQKLVVSLEACIIRINERVEQSRMKDVYDCAIESRNAANSESDYETVIKQLNTILGYQDTAEQIQFCQRQIEDLKATQERKRLEAERKAEQLRVAAEKRRQKVKKVAIIGFMVACIFIAILVVLDALILPAVRYNNAVKLVNGGEYEEAATIFKELGSYKDSIEQTKECLYLQAIIWRDEQKFDEANVLFEQIKDYKDSAELIHLHNYEVTASGNATCSKEGYKEFKCSGCDEIYRETLKATGKHSYKVTASGNATCSKEGYKEFKCSGCDEIYREILKATGKHSYKVVNSKNATCETGGFKDYKCSTCNHSYRDEIKATGHSYSSATCSAPKKCNICGKISGSALGHTTDEISCSRCGTIIFNTLTYSGKGDKEFRNINIPKGNFIISGRATSTDGYAGSFDVYLKQSNAFTNTAWWCATVLSYSRTITETEDFSGPVSGGYLKVNAGDNVEWTITIEAIG